MTARLRTMLTDLADDIEIVDRSGSAARAWAGARLLRRRQWRLRVAGAGAVVAALAVAVPLGLSRVQTPRIDLPATTPTPSSVTRSGQPAPLVVGGVTVDQLPAATLASLTSLVVEADGAPLPTALAVERDDAVPALAGGVGTAGRVGAVLVRDLGADRFHPVFFVGGSIGGFVEATRVTLTPFGSPVNGKRMVLGAHIVAPDGYRVGFVQDGSVIFVDIRDGSVRQVSIPTDHLESGGWSAAGTWFIAHSESRTWRIDPAGPTVQPAAEDVHEGHHLVASDGTTVHLARYDDSGTPVSRREVSPLLGSSWADSVTSPGGLVATGCFTAPDISSAVNGFQGMSFVGFDEDGSFERPRAVVLTGLLDAPKGAFSALRWVSEDVVLYRLAGNDAVRLMAWDIVQGRNWFVADLPRTDLGYRFALGVGLQATTERPRSTPDNSGGSSATT